LTHVITAACIGAKEQTCVATCPVDCILGSEEDVMLFIDPELCIDCGACVPACPVNAIYVDKDLPGDMEHFLVINRQYFVDEDATRRVVAELTT